MELDYEKKDISKSPKAKEVKYDGDVYCKRGEWFAVNLVGKKAKFATEKEAVEWLTN